MPTIVPFYASLLAALYIFLSVRVIRMRVTSRVGLGDGSDPRLQRAIRVHANFSEYVPFALILVAFVEMQHSAPVFVHALCLSLLTGRLVHSYAVSQQKEDVRLRVAGMTLTFVTIRGAALRLFVAFLFGL
jgi:uncharacterized membrane protein YecN with MAPEG domain